MEYGKIIAISGMGGLYELVGSKKDGAIVRSLDDKSTKFVSSRIHNFSHLESIEVYTSRENVNLVEILSAMDTAEETLPSDKDAGAIKAYFEKVYPEMDFERVYASDMKKMIKWYSALKTNEVDLKLPPEQDEADNTANEKQEISTAAGTEEETNTQAGTEEEIIAPADIDEASDEKTFEVVETDENEQDAPEEGSKNAEKVTDTVVPAADKDVTEPGLEPEAETDEPAAAKAPKKKATAAKKKE